MVDSVAGLCRASKIADREARRPALTRGGPLAYREMQKLEQIEAQAPASGQSRLAPDSFTTRPHFSMSDRSTLVNSAGAVR